MEKGILEDPFNQVAAGKDLVPGTGKESRRNSLGTGLACRWSRGRVRVGGIVWLGGWDGLGVEIRSQQMTRSFRSVGRLRLPPLSLPVRRGMEGGWLGLGRV